MYLDLHTLHIQCIQVRPRVVWQVEPLQRSNCGRLTLRKNEKKRLKQQSSLNPKKMGFRIIPELYPNHASNFPILNLGTFARSELVFCEPCSSILQWHQHANSKAHTTLTAAPCSSTLQRHQRPERTRHSNSCTLQQQRAAVPFTGTLAERVGYIVYSPCSSSTSWLA